MGRAEDAVNHGAHLWALGPQDLGVRSNVTTAVGFRIKYICRPRSTSVTLWRTISYIIDQILCKILPSKCLI